MTTGGLTLDELAVRTRTSQDWLREVLADEQRRGRVETDADGRFRLTVRAERQLGEAFRGFLPPSAGDS